MNSQNIALSSLKKPVRDFIWFSRQNTSTFRSLPKFIVIGAQKSGTSSLYTYLAQHQEIKMSFLKEIHYFDFNYSKDIAWYRKHFPLNTVLNLQGTVTGECTPYYLAHPLCAQRIFESVPSVKLIVLLRNPTYRAISHYFHEVRAGREANNIEDALAMEAERLDGELELMTNNPHYYSYNHHHYSYKARGRYAEQLVRYMNVFDRDQLLILKAEELFEKPSETLREVLKFINLDPQDLPMDLTPINSGSYSSRVPEKVYTDLEQYFEPFNQELATVLDEENWW